MKFNPSQIQDKLRTHAIALIDIRQNGMYLRSKVGGINIPLMELSNKATRTNAIDKIKSLLLRANPQKNKPEMILIGCNSGTEHGETAQGILQTYFPEVHTMAGGIFRFRSETNGKVLFVE
jgi:rhodanese-related sulfurtransferase